jgi:pimeloyl-ACP methyl ester carboxylesterase
LNGAVPGNAAEGGELVREGEFWTMGFRGRTVRLRDSKGVGYLAELLARPGREIPALTLAGAVAGERSSAAEAAQAGLVTVAGSDTGPLLDDRAKAAYRRRLTELRAELEEAERFHDPERAARMRVEYEAVGEQLALAAGLGGRDRRAGSATERARLNVTRAIRAVIGRVSEHDPALGEHLERSVSTGRVCVYRPHNAAPVAWTVRRRFQNVGGGSARARGVEGAAAVGAPAVALRDVDVRFARCGDVRIAYATFGDGPVDVVFVPGFFSHLESWWEAPAAAQFFDRIASFCRLIMFDKRGTGMSDPFVGVPTLEQRIDDVHAVMEAVGSSSAFIVGLSEGGSMSVLFAGLHPAMTRGLILIGATGRWSWAPDYPIGHPPTWTEALLEEIDERWGRGALIDRFLPSLAQNERAQRMWARAQRLGSTPGLARALVAANAEIDVRDILPDIQVPTLVIHRIDDRAVPVSHGRYLADHIPDARLFEQHGDHLPWIGEAEPILDEIERFVTSPPQRPEIDRVLATVMLVQMVEQFDSDPEAGRIADAASALLRACRDEVSQCRGRLMSTDTGVRAAFDGPSRAIGCARAIRRAAADLGLYTRTGLHVGECERHGTELSGTAVMIATRLAERAGPGEIIISRTVKDLVAGSGLRFDGREVVALPDASEPIALYALAD